MCVLHICAWCLWRSEGVRVTHSFELSCGAGYQIRSSLQHVKILLKCSKSDRKMRGSGDKAVNAQADDLSLIPGTRAKWKEKIDYTKLSSDPYTHAMVYVYSPKNHFFKLLFFFTVQSLSPFCSPSNSSFIPLSSPCL